MNRRLAVHPFNPDESLDSEQATPQKSSNKRETKKKLVYEEPIYDDFEQNTKL